MTSIQAAYKKLERYRNAAVEMGFEADPLPGDSPEEENRVLKPIDDTDVVERDFGFHFGIDIPRRMRKPKHKVFHLFIRYDEETGALQPYLEEFGMFDKYVYPIDSMNDFLNLLDELV